MSVPNSGTSSALYLTGPQSALVYYPGASQVASPVLSKQSSGEMAPRIRRISFGDGYEQRSPAGVQTLALKLDATFLNRPYRQIEAIAAFLLGRPPFNSGTLERQPSDWFWLHVPAELDPYGFPEDQLMQGFSPEPLKFVYTTYRITPGEGMLSSMSISLMQVHDL